MDTEATRPPSQIKKSIKHLREELEQLRIKKYLLEQEAGYREALERMHPTKRKQAIMALGKVLGGVQKEIRGTPAKRRARKAKIRKALKKFKAGLEKEERSSRRRYR